MIQEKKDARAGVSFDKEREAEAWSDDDRSLDKSNRSKSLRSPAGRSASQIPHEQLMDIKLVDFLVASHFMLANLDPPVGRTERNV